MKKYFLFVFVLFLMSCATVQKTHFVVGINSFSRPDTSIHQRLGKTFLIFPGNKDTSINDLEFMEFSSYVEKALISRGLEKESDFKKADIAVFLAYGIGEPKEHTFSYSLPVWGQTGVSSKKTTGNLFAFGDMGTYSETTTYTPKYGIKGYKTQQGSFTTHSRYVYITGYDLAEFRKNENEKILWETRIASVGSSGDLRRVFPVMIGASLDFIGKNTGKIIDVKLYEDDERVLFIKGENIE